MLPEGSTVSMNMWGFSASILKELKARFAAFLDENLEKNPLKCEYFLPFVVDELLQEKKATVKVLKSEDKWYGVTYKRKSLLLWLQCRAKKDQGSIRRTYGRRTSNSEYNSERSNQSV